MATAFERLNSACERRYAITLLYRESGGRETAIEGIVDSAELAEEGNKFLEIWFDDANLVVASVTPRSGDLIIDDASSVTYSVIDADKDAAGGVSVKVQVE